MRQILFSYDSFQVPEAMFNHLGHAFSRRSATIRALGFCDTRATRALLRALSARGHQQGPLPCHSQAAPCPRKSISVLTYIYISYIYIYDDICIYIFESGKPRGIPRNGNASRRWRRTAIFSLLIYYIVANILYCFTVLCYFLS